MGKPLAVLRQIITVWVSFSKVRAHRSTLTGQIITAGGGRRLDRGHGSNKTAAAILPHVVKLAKMTQSQKCVEFIKNQLFAPCVLSEYILFNSLLKFQTTTSFWTGCLMAAGLRSSVLQRQTNKCFLKRMHSFSKKQAESYCTADCAGSSERKQIIHRSFRLCSLKCPKKSRDLNELNKSSSS